MYASSCVRYIATGSAMAKGGVTTSQRLKWWEWSPGPRRRTFCSTWLPEILVFQSCGTFPPPSMSIFVLSSANQRSPAKRVTKIAASAQYLTTKLGYRCYLMINQIEISLNFEETAVIWNFRFVHVKLRQIHLGCFEIFDGPKNNRCEKKLRVRKHTVQIWHSLTAA